MTFSVQDAFSWIDEDGGDNVDGEYDIFPDGVSSEPPVAMVIRGFKVDVIE